MNRFDVAQAVKERVSLRRLLEIWEGRRYSFRTKCGLQIKVSSGYFDSCHGYFVTLHNLQGKFVNQYFYSPAAFS